MADKPMDVYLNDHLGGATLGVDLAEQIRDQNEGTPLGELMTSIAPEIEEDRETLLDLMERMGARRTPSSRSRAGWPRRPAGSSSAARSSGEPDHGAFMALESLTLGVRGKWCLWTALKEVASQYPALASMDLDVLIHRAEAQHGALEGARLDGGPQGAGGEG